MQEPQIGDKVRATMNGEKMKKMSETQKKAAAKELCRMRGTNPDSVEGFNGHNSATANTPAWRVVMKEIEAQEMLELAMQYGRGHEA